jgi:hypothetical protein
MITASCVRWSRLATFTEAGAFRVNYSSDCSSRSIAIYFGYSPAGEAAVLQHAHVDGIPGDHAALKIGDVRHQRRASGAKAENGIFDDGRARANGVLESLMMCDLLGVAFG